jgi:hypothetical protein
LLYHIIIIQYSQMKPKLSTYLQVNIVR